MVGLPFQSLEDFVKVILENVKPVRGRKLFAEVLPGSLDFKSYVSQLRVEVAGLTHTAFDAADATHCWRFIRRSETYSNYAIMS